MKVNHIKTQKVLTLCFRATIYLIYTTYFQHFMLNFAEQL